MNIERWSETSEILEAALQKHGHVRAASVAAARCLGSQSKGELAADILAFNDLYPILLQDKTKPIVYIVFKLTAYGLNPSQHTKESLETTLTIYGDAELRESWCWRGL